jgi:hypothetical protein
VKREQAEEATRLLKKIKICEESAPQALIKLYRNGEYAELHKTAAELIEELKDIYSSLLAKL